MTVHKNFTVNGSVSIPDRFPESFTWDFATQGIGHWGAPQVGAQYSVVGGEFEARNFGNDDNHLTSKGGPGRLFLPAFADHHYWRHLDAQGKVVGSDFTNAQVEMEVRGIEGFQIPSGCSFIPWITADHPDFPPYPNAGFKIANWGFVGEPRPITGTFQKVSWRLDPNASWVFGAGLGIYDQPLSLREALQNIHNFHVVLLGPDNATAPTGAFRMRNPRIVFNRNGLPLQSQRWGAKAPAVTLLDADLKASHGPFTSTGGVRSLQPLNQDGAYWESTHISGNIALSFAFGVANAAHNPAVQSGTFFCDTANGWGYLTDRGDKRHNFADVHIGPSSLPAGTTVMCALKNGDLWFGANGTWFTTAPAYTGVLGEIYAFESNGTGNGSFVWKANFGDTPFIYNNLPWS